MMANAEKPRITITVCSGVNNGVCFHFTQNLISMGRAEDNDLTLLQDTAISSRHAELRFKDGQWYIGDAGSKNGTYVETKAGRQRIEGATIIRPKQKFVLGKTIFSMDERRDEPIREAADSGAQPAFHLLSPTILKVSCECHELKWQIIEGGACGTVYTSPFVQRDAESVCQQLNALAISANIPCARDNGPSFANGQAALIELGDFIAEHFMPPGIRKKILRTSNAPLFLMHDAQTAVIPWEIARLDGEYLCLRFNLGRQLVVEDYSAEFKRPPGESLARMLIVGNPAGDLPEAQKHAEALFTKLQETYSGLQLEFLADSRVERLNMIQRLNQVDAVYYVGHADYDNNNPALSGWRLKNGRLTAQDFRKLRRPPALVFANGCETGREGPNGPAPALGIYGMASALLLAGVRHHIGSVWPIPAQQGAAFALDFLDGLLCGRPIGACMLHARRRAFREVGGENPIWAAYTLYGNPSQTVFAPGKPLPHRQTATASVKL